MDKSFCAREKPKSGKNAYRRRVHIYISEAEIWYRDLWLCLPTLSLLR